MRSVIRFGFGLAALAGSAAPAFAHHVMGGRTPATAWEGVLSGLGHPVIGLDHLAAVVAVGCLAAAHRAGAMLALAFVLTMMAGVALHVQGLAVPAGEVLVALSVVALGALMVTRRMMSPGAAGALVALAGLLHGYALGESIYGAESTPLYAYLAGLAVIQSVIALAAMTAARWLTQDRAPAVQLRLIGAGISGIGLAILAQQIIPGA